MMDVEIDNRERFGNIRDQSPLPTCLAHATSTGHRDAKGIDDPLSAEALHYHANHGDLESAISIEEVQMALQNAGQPKIHYCDPVPPQDPSRWSPPADAHHFKSESKNFSSEAGLIINQIKNDNHPILGITYPREFRNPESPWVLSGGVPVGSPHAVVGVGFGENRDGKAILIRNSWGVEWGDSGHVWLDSSYIESHLLSVFVIPRMNSL